MPETAPESSNARAAHTVIPEDVAYGVASFHAIVKPVLLTMILSALSVIYINTPESQEAQRQGLSNTYTVLGETTGEDSNRLARSLVNALVIIVVICCMTFLIVLLYKYRCMKALGGYMMLASTAILGLLAGTMFDVAMKRYHLEPDKISVYLFLYNFAIVGTLSIFVPRTAPMYMTQLYLILTSVIVAWQLSNFDDWTAWTLLVFLALYDLFAVLTPCGPLKALIRLMQQDDAPAMPGLLYEASISTGQNAHRSQQLPTEASIETRASIRNVETPELTATVDTDALAQHTPSPHDEETSDGNANSTSEIREISDIHDEERIQERAVNALEEPKEAERSDEEMDTSTLSATLIHAHNTNSQNVETPPPADAFVTCRIPLAIAKLYKLRLADNLTPRWIESHVTEENIGENTQLNQEHLPEHTTDQLRAEVDALLPAGGGRIERSGEQTQPGEILYSVFNRNGELRRTVFVNAGGKVCQIIPGQQNGEDSSPVRDSIKLGLGDFIFYSILVSKAAVFSFTTFAACTLVIVFGLGLTLLILAVYRKPLPALPISIFLGVATYLIMRFIIQYFFEEVFIQGVYV